MQLETLNLVFPSVKNSELYGRYLTNSHIEKCIEKLPKSRISTLGFSVESRPIYGIKYGKGSIRILLWSQMHGNESTSTKALFDCFNLFEKENELGKNILQRCTLMFIPILNPDGAEKYTRVNANKIDLNRDAQNLSQPESKVLRQVYEDFKPDYCFNLHGQRTIFSSGDTNNVATLSFLSPAEDEERSLTANRKEAMAIISQISKFLQPEIPNGIGRYDDGFNLNCVGDTFQRFGIPTILYEAGHYHEDYQREEVRRLMFIALMKGLDVITTSTNTNHYDDYFNIPENSKCFYDIIIRNTKLNLTDDGLIDIAIQYQEKLINGQVHFIPVVQEISKLQNKFGHKEIDAHGVLLETDNNSTLTIGNEIDFVLLDNKKTSLIP
ncbi:M14 family metallopeptidase [Winogradskyella bathintestinalis]|uniref:M14 family metallopeptidase n=1 Tax=Winogradskyella bathintestinalis TaxID=3035208 RepID=A0ABT7ZXM0_9FLAO|nr:M14 metallopeptidase family protein [Winogradskyella bathintestinalis]MDN3493724.1 M14 family metallopeptidase [Winogradskyella bathintestinalis]